MSGIEISVIIPTHNRSEALSWTLKCLAGQEFDGAWEVIVVNNNSTDDTASVVEAWGERYPVPLTLLHETKPGPAAARNTGARAAAGETIVFIDNDIEVPRDFLALHFETLRANPRCWFIGRILNAPAIRETSFGRYRDDLYESYFRSLPSEELFDYEGATGANWALRKGEFFEVGGFDEGFSIASCEDAELALRARRKGIRTMFNPKSVVLHNDWAVDLDSFCRRQELYSISSVLLWRKYGDECFLADMVRQNKHIDPENDPGKLKAKKICKALFASEPGFEIAKLTCKLVGRLAPDTVIASRFYNLAASIAIFRGVRQGLDRYGVEGGRSPQADRQPC